nr:MAG TPA: hypothetical protein [Caudoviricetes sp.]
MYFVTFYHRKKTPRWMPFSKYISQGGSRNFLI